MSATIASPARSIVVDAARRHLACMAIPEPGYAAFLMDQLGRWDGLDVHITTVADGKLVMLPLNMVRDPTDPVMA